MQQVDEQQRAQKRAEKAAKQAARTQKVSLKLSARWLPCSPLAYTTCIRFYVPCYCGADPVGMVAWQDINVPRTAGEREGIEEDQAADGVQRGEGAEEDAEPDEGPFSVLMQSQSIGRASARRLALSERLTQRRQTQAAGRAAVMLVARPKTDRTTHSTLTSTRVSMCTTELAFENR